jgi:hypothetical protein
VTEKGYVGLGRPGVGDEVWILGGGQVPFLLRPTGKRYLFVENCYVHGVMEGEVIDDWESNVATVTIC